MFLETLHFIYSSRFPTITFSDNLLTNLVGFFVRAHFCLWSKFSNSNRILKQQLRFRPHYRCTLFGLLIELTIQLALLFLRIFLLARRFYLRYCFLFSYLEVRILKMAGDTMEYCHYLLSIYQASIFIYNNFLKCIRSYLKGCFERYPTYSNQILLPSVPFLHHPSIKPSDLI